MDTSFVRNIKDFQLLYNQISETCFKTCVSTFISRDVSIDEDQCIENCSGKHINANHKIMEIFMEVQPLIIRKNVEEFQKSQANLETQVQNEQSVENKT
ncbi:mitochondrial import inner membrane translocase subunit Tim10 B [Megachile rotundata]|uniref:mitochondrial import inner membrane translocase subunit Tim10 B n=1 Tax=Megachile rotundata TaxID=143995 RepID=UPI000258D9E8|nr:PREDICTED: mitochondrial import inner membrane translocase subunit Tim10 B [Megachile rotundata]